MKVLISYASSGFGHKKAAEAIFQYLIKNKKDTQVKIVDILDNASWPIFFSYSQLYLLLVKYVPWLWGFLFYFSSLPLIRISLRRINLAFALFFARPFISLLFKEDWDWVISTHFLCSEIIGHLKGKGILPAKLATVVTDFYVHPFWAVKSTDKFFVPSDYSAKILVRLGIKEENILITGIPIAEKFLFSSSKSQILRGLGLNESLFTALITSGSFALGPILKIVSRLHKDFQLIVVCGNNRKLFSILKRKQFPNCEIFGYTDEVANLMNAADIIITKPGGLTIAELLTRGLYPVFFTAIPGQEKKNLEFLLRLNIGKKASSVNEVVRIVSDLASSPEHINASKPYIDSLRRPLATKEIVDALRQGSGRDSCGRTL